ncbi:MAG: bifunctional phosphoribosyl-AMP cyclohydrolase/phosphoribosyl-ATP diphosphatase HisIE [Pseudomonadota bacterium]
MSLKPADIDTLDWTKGDGLLPAVVQDATTGAVLMLAYMNRDALRASFERNRVVFFSRSRAQLWEKGETSGNTLKLVAIEADCDGDTLLVSANPTGPVCHRNTATCFGDGNIQVGVGFLAQLEGVIEQRIAEQPEGSYTARLYAEGIKRMAQKVGEEGVEVALAASLGTEQELVAESADLLYHLTLLLKSRGLSLAQVSGELAARHKAR